MFDRTILCISLSKTYLITGWRFGYIIASEKIINEARKVHDFLTVGAAAPLQKAAVTALKFPDSYYDELQSQVHRNEKYLSKRTEKIGLKSSNPQGAYYVMVDIKDFEKKNDMEFCEWMI